MTDFDKSMIIGDDDFNEKLESKILPWVEQHLLSEDIKSADGTRLRIYYAIHPQERAAIVISHGFCEFVGKYHELMYYFYNWGYSVFFVEYRGHGHSDHMLEEMDRVAVKDYADYVADLDALVTIAKERSQTKKFILFAHSMGGCIGSFYLEEHPEVFSKAILSAPMLQMNYAVPGWTVYFLMFISKVLKWELRYAPGQHGFDNQYVFETSSAMSKQRYDYVFHQRQADENNTSYGATYSWTNASIQAVKRVQRDASKIQIPVLIFQAEKDTMVGLEGQQTFVDQLINGELVVAQGSKHEIFNALLEQRIPYYEKIFTFLEEV